MKPTSGIDLLEQAFGLLRRLTAAVWLIYFLGTGSFLLAFLFFWEEMTQSSRAADRVGTEALVLAVLLLAMFASQSLFSTRLRQVLEPTQAIDGTRLLLLQCLIQPTKLLVLPACAMALLPFAPAAAFYQHCGALRAVDLTSWRQAIGQAWRLTRQSTGQTWVAFGVFFAFGLLVWLNLLILMAFLPELCRMFLGIESEFSRAGANLVFTSTFFRISLAATYVILEPLWRAVQVLKGFEGESLATGADLRRLIRLATAAAVLLCCAPAQAGQIPPPQLEQSIAQTLQNPEFSWRNPRAVRKAQLPGWLEALQHGTRAIFRGINQGLRTFFDWLESLFDRRINLPRTGDAPVNGLRTSSYLVIAVCAALILGLLIRQWRAKPTITVAAEASAQATIELTDETLLPTDREEDEWTNLGQELLAQGETRLALRAMYLGSLAHLARQQWIQVHRGKSNLDYLRELSRRAKGLAGLETNFARNLRIYERTWYGDHPATAESIAEFGANLEKIKSHA